MTMKVQNTVLILCVTVYTAQAYQTRKDIIAGTNMSMEHSDLRDLIADTFTTHVTEAEIIEPEDKIWKLPKMQELIGLGSINNVRPPRWNGLGDMDEDIFKKHIKRIIGDSGNSDGGSDPDEEVRRAFEKAEMCSDIDEKVDVLTDAGIDIFPLSVEKAMTVFRRALQIAPHVAKSKMNLGVALMKHGKYDEACKLIEEAYQQEPNGNVKENLEDCLNLQKQDVHGIIASKLKELSSEFRIPVPEIRKPLQRIPRLTLEEFYQPENFQFRSGDKPFILHGVFSNHDIRDLQERFETFLEYFSDKCALPYLPYGNQFGGSRKAIHGVTSLKRAIKMLEYTQGKPLKNAAEFRNVTNHGQNIMWMPTRLEWETLRSFLKLHRHKLPDLFTDEQYGLHSGGAFSEQKSLSSYVKALSWRLITLGSENGGVSVHQDGLPLGAWQLQLTGAKTWFICAEEHSLFFGGIGKVDPFNPDFNQSAPFAMAECLQNTIYPGEFVFYPSFYWHATVYHSQVANEKFNSPWNLVPLSGSIGSRVLQEKRVAQHLEDLDENCEKENNGVAATNFFQSRPRFCTQDIKRYKSWASSAMRGEWSSSSSSDHCHDEGLTEEQLEDVHDFALDEDIIDDLKMTHKWVKERYS